MSKDYIANQATKDFMRKVGAIPDKKYPNSGALEFDDEGNVSWYVKGVKKTLQKGKIPPGVGMTEEEENLVLENKMNKNSLTESFKMFPTKEDDKSVPSTPSLPKSVKKNAFNAAIEGGMKYIKDIANGRDK